MKKYSRIVSLPIGCVQITSDGQSLLGLSFSKNMSQNDLYNDHVFLDTVETQLNEYFLGKRKSFDFAIITTGTEFQKLIWKELVKIEYGKTKAYSEIAADINRPNTTRAIGGACNKNKLPIIIPCHRVVGKSGNLTGFAGGIETKEFLLKLEGVI
jgi:methylated-DNA-[protein]-cysteine S-methyltransferase